MYSILFGDSLLGIRDVSAEKHKPYLRLHLLPVRDDGGSAFVPQFLIVWGEDLQNSPFFLAGQLQQSAFVTSESGQEFKVEDGSSFRAASLS